VTIVETTTNTSMTCAARLRAVASGHLGLIQGTAQIELMRTSDASGLRVANVAPVYQAIKGTTVSAIAARKASALLPISDVVVFDGFAGIRSWSPPV
jgi:hypothetical protein